MLRNVLVFLVVVAAAAIGVSVAQMPLTPPLAVFTFLLAWGIASSFVTLELFEYGVHERFGRATGWIFYSGLHLVLPFGIERVHRISTKLTSKIDFGRNNIFTMRSKLQLIEKGSVQYRPDPRVTMSRNLEPIRTLAEGWGGGLFGREERFDAPNTYYGIEEDVIESGIAEAVESKLGGITGRYTEEDFIRWRQPLTAYVNAIFRIENPIHLNHKLPCEACKKENERPKAQGEKPRTFPAGEIGTDQILDFYEVHWKEAKEAEKNERKEIGRSETEWTYGIDIVVVALPVVDFTPDTKKALEEAQQAILRRGAVLTQGELMEELMKRNVPAQIAANLVQMVLESEGTSRQILSIESSGEGSGGDAIVAAAALLAGKKGGK